MAGGGGGGGGDRIERCDFYEVLGLEKECSDADLRSAYKKLAMRWHPDRCSASGDSKFVEEAKKKFQAIQEAYSVLSDGSKRLLYDVGIYDNNDDDNNDGMDEFLSEMVVMMSQTKPSEKGHESFEQLQEIFEEMFNGGVEDFSLTSRASTASCSSSPYGTCSRSSSSSNKRNSSDIEAENFREEPTTFDACFQSFCVGAGGPQGRSEERKGKRKRNTRRSTA
ncbi:hypothetical protein Drorol1_Dr00013402 [Drosera rotundifolia]